MKHRNLFSMLLPVMVGASVLAGCGEDKNAVQVNSGMSKEGQELAGNITFWHSFTQGPRLEVIQ